MSKEMKVMSLEDEKKFRNEMFKDMPIKPKSEYPEPEKKPVEQLKDRIAETNLMLKHANIQGNEFKNPLEKNIIEREVKEIRQDMRSIQMSSTEVLTIKRELNNIEKKLGKEQGMER